MKGVIDGRLESILQDVLVGVLEGVDRTYH